MHFRQPGIAIRCAAIMLFAAPFLAGQTLTTGDVTGLISDPTGAVVPSVEVTLKKDATSEGRSVMTNAEGRYRFSLLAPGEYTRSEEHTSELQSLRHLVC